MCVLKFIENGGYLIFLKLDKENVFYKIFWNIVSA